MTAEDCAKRMATKIDKETQALQYQFPIIATNLRALVSSWLPPARESSPDDGEDASRAIQGRPERLGNPPMNCLVDGTDWLLEQRSLEFKLIPAKLRIEWIERWVCGP